MAVKICACIDECDFELEEWHADARLGRKRALKVSKSSCLRSASEMYQKQMKAYNTLDFDDLIALPVLLLKTNQEVRERWQSRIRHLPSGRIPRYQHSQYELVRLLVGESVVAWR